MRVGWAAASEVARGTAAGSTWETARVPTGFLLVEEVLALVERALEALQTVVVCGGRTTMAGARDG